MRKNTIFNFCDNYWCFLYMNYEKWKGDERFFRRKKYYDENSDKMEISKQKINNKYLCEAIIKEIQLQCY